MTRYVGYHQLCPLAGLSIAIAYTGRDALDNRLDMLQARGHRGERCRSCLDCTRGCSTATSRPLRRGWRATWHRKERPTNVH